MRFLPGKAPKGRRGVIQAPEVSQSYVKGQEKLQNFNPPKWTLYNSGKWVVDMPDNEIDQDNDEDVDKAPAGLKNVAFARTAIFAGDGRIGKTLISEAKAIKCCMKLQRD